MLGIIRYAQQIWTFLYGEIFEGVDISLKEERMRLELMRSEISIALFI